MINFKDVLSEEIIYNFNDGKVIVFKRNRLNDFILSIKEDQHFRLNIEIKDNEVYQIDGGNKNGYQKKYLDMVIPWLIQNNYKIDYNNFKFIVNKRDNKAYSFNKIPDDCEVDGNIDLSYCNLKEIFSKNFIINGNLNLNHTNVVKLNKGLIVNGNLDLSFLRIIKLPQDLVVKGNLNLSCTLISKLQDNMIINGDLILNGCEKLEELPNNLIVNGNLDLSYTKIKEIPKNIIIKGNVDLCMSQIEKIPDNLKCSNLDISNRHVYLIKDTMEFDKITVGFVEYTKQEFFELYDNLKIMSL